MTPTPLLILMAGVLYLTIGLAAFRTAERRNFDGENWRLVYNWPAVFLVAGVVLTLVLPVIYDTIGGGL